MHPSVKWCNDPCLPTGEGTTKSNSEFLEVQLFIWAYSKCKIDLLGVNPDSEFFIFLPYTNAGYKWNKIPQQNETYFSIKARWSWKRKSGLGNCHWHNNLSTMLKQQWNRDYTAARTGDTKFLYKLFLFLWYTYFTPVLLIQGKLHQKKISLKLHMPKYLLRRGLWSEQMLLRWRVVCLTEHSLLWNIVCPKEFWRWRSLHIGLLKNGRTNRQRYNSIVVNAVTRKLHELEVELTLLLSLQIVAQRKFIFFAIHHEEEPVFYVLV